VIEYATGVTRQIGGRATLRADYVYRNYRDFYSQRIDTTTGKVLAIDVEPKLVGYMKERAVREKLPQMHAALIKPDDPGLPEGGVDLVIVVDTWHHIDERVRYLAKVARGLKADGRVAVVDFKKGSLPVGPPDEHKLAPEQIVGEFERAGWSLVRRDEELLPYQYVLVFAKPKR